VGRWRALFIVRPWLLKLGESTSKSESIPQSKRREREREAERERERVAATPRSVAATVTAGLYRGGAIHGEGRRVSNNEQRRRTALPPN